MNMSYANAISKVFANEEQTGIILLTSRTRVLEILVN